MPEPLTVAAGTVGILSFGITVAQGLVKYYSAYKGCPEDVLNLVGSLKSLTDLLKQVQRLLESDRLKGASRASVEQNVTSCKALIEKLQSKLDKYPTTTTEHSLRKLVYSHLLRATYPFKVETLTKLQKTLSGLERNLNTALQVVNLYVSLLCVLHTLISIVMFYAEMLLT